MKLGRKVFKGKALLETDELIFRGESRLRIPIKEMDFVAAKHGVLRVDFRGKSASFELADKAEAWMKKILHPKSLLDKLGVEPDSRAGVLGMMDKKFLKQLSERAAYVSVEKIQKDSDIIFYAADGTKDLAGLKRLVPYLKSDGALWVVSLKGSQATVKDTEVMAAGKKAGLVDTKVVGFSETHTALKFVIPASER